MTDVPMKLDQFERADPILTNKIVTQLKSQGIFDEFRRECMADVDTKPAYQNLRQRVEGSVAAFLKSNPWRPDMNKNQMRDNLRKHIQSGGFLDIGVDRIVDQVVNPKIYTVFLPKVEELVHSCMDVHNGVATFKPPPQPQPKPESPKFQNKHNLAPRATLSGPRLPFVPPIETLKPPEPAEETPSTAEEHSSPASEKPADQSFVMDEEEEDADDDEESPPFEPVARSDRLILGIRTDSSDSNSDENQVVTTIVDDNLEERIDKNVDESEKSDDKEVVKEEEEKDGFSSDNSIPKTPTINLEESDGTLIEFDSISEYKRYQNKFDEESCDNVEEVVSSQWAEESGYVVKEERSSNEEDSGGVSQKRKYDYQHFDEKSSSSFDKSSSCDEGKSNSFTSSTPKKVKLDDENHTISELMINDDSNTDKSMDPIDVKQNHSTSEHRDKSKSGSSNSKEGKSHHHHHSHKEQKKSSSHHRSSSRGKHSHKEHKESSTSNHSSREKRDHSSKDHDGSKDRRKEKERKSSYSSSKHHSSESKYKLSDNDKETDSEKKSDDKSDVDKKDKIESDKDRRDSKHEYRDRSRDRHDKEKKSQDRHEKHSDIKKDHSASHKHGSDRRDGSKSSKHSHSSSKHGHRSSEKHRSDKDEKHTDSSDKHKSHEKKSDKDSKHESKKKSKEYCKSGEKDFEGRRSSDRDSNGPGSRHHFSNNSTTKSSSSSRNNVETSIYSSDKTTSNSDNTVSDNIEPLHVDTCKLDSISEQGIASPDPEITEEPWNESDFHESNSTCDKEITDPDEPCSPVVHHENELSPCVDCDRDDDKNYDSSHDCIIVDDTKQLEPIEYGKSSETGENSTRTCDTFQALNESVCDSNDTDEQDIPNSAHCVHDTSSEKENIDIAVNFEKSENVTNDVFSNPDDKIIKFKKPKIAANIFEVRKIMQERRHLKRMEKKRLKLLMKNNTQDCSIDESSEKKIEEQDGFLGFEDVATNKIEAYDCLISRLNSEISMANDFEVSPNLLTSLIEVNPDLDEYIENVLKGKVHRKYRVRVPPIGNEFYIYDVEQNAYILIKNPNELVDKNLNRLSPVLKNHGVYSNNGSNESIPDTFEQSCSKSRLDVPEESSSPKSVTENQNFILHASLDSDDSKSPTFVEDSSSSSDSSKEELYNTNSLEEPKLIIVDDIASIGISNGNASDVNIPRKLAFSLTFNQTYDEILKEKEEKAEIVSNHCVETDLMDKSENRGSTVVKITNNLSSEQVILKRVEYNFVNKSQVPKITRSESVVNGKLTEQSPQSKQMPLITRIHKSNNVVLAPASSAKSRRMNGIASTESTSLEAEVALPDNISPKTINDMVGIVDSAVDHRTTSGVTCLRQRNTKESKLDGLKNSQRYNSSDLYKPRPQLGTRRNRGQSSPGVDVPVPDAITRKRAASTPDVAVIRPKRRR